MNKTLVRRNSSVKYPILLTPKERLAIAHQALGSWKRPLKSTLQTLAAIRRGLDRRIG